MSQGSVAVEGSDIAVQDIVHSCVICEQETAARFELCCSMQALLWQGML